jgi:dTDP-4-dehydrorhamnose reductase
MTPPNPVLSASSGFQRAARVAVTGAAGQLGREFCRQLGDCPIPLDMPDLDITDSDQVRRAMRAIRPDAIIHCAAYTRVDKAEEEPDLCFRTNADGVRFLVEAATENHCPLVHISTDYVFGADATRTRPYVESDTPGPMSVYARSKLAGEEHARNYDKHLIVRTCGLYGESPRGNNFVHTMLRLACQRGPLRVVDDQHCTPSYVVHVARATRYLMTTGACGTFHIVNGGSTTWYDFAKEIFRLRGLDVDLEKISSAMYAAPAPRPHYSVLDTGKYEALGGPPLPHWQEALAEYLAVSLTP